MSELDQFTPKAEACFSLPELKANMSVWFRLGKEKKLTCGTITYIDRDENQIWVTYLSDDVVLDIQFGKSSTIIAAEDVLGIGAFKPNHLN